MSWLESLKKNSLVITLVCIYLGADMIFTGKNIYFFNLLPVVLLLIYLTLARLDLMYFIIIFCTPISVQLIDFFPSSPIDFAIPTEPMLFGMMVIFYYKILYDRSLDIRILNHPVSYAIYFNVIWILITTLTSSMPLVSIKFLLARVWFITIYYFLAILVFRKYRSIPVFIWSYAIAMIFVVIFTISRHLQYGLDDVRAAHIVMSPFFRDHTSYGAILAMLIFAVGGAILYRGSSISFRILLWGTWLLLAAGLLLSYTRAAWMSLIVAAGILGLTILRIQFKYILVAGIFCVIYLGEKRTDLLQKMEQNRQKSSSSLTEHVRSMSNISTDESNLERINRWNSAIRMFREKPVFGHGPGTYMFKYAPYQRSWEKTAISTNFGDLGNAHSEYIGPLAESGFFGGLSIVIIGIVSLITGFRVYKRLTNKRLKGIVLGMVLGLITYLVHGSLNNFLDTDKASALFWGFIAAFVSLDIFYPWEDQNKGRDLEELNTKH
jgi:putative inorganic carbon (HCO3(-)) transporter